MTLIVMMTQLLTILMTMLAAMRMKLMMVFQVLHLKMTHQLSGQNLPTIEMSLAIQNVLYVLIEISMARQSLLLIHCGNVLLEF